MAASTITTFFHDPEPLPRYTRDPETSSINSAAPSYTSEAPSYHSTYPEAHNQHATSTSTATTNPTTRRIISFHMTVPSDLTGNRTPTGHAPQAQTAAQRQRARYSMDSGIQSLAARMMRPAQPAHITFPDSAGFVNEAKARKAYIRELREEAELRERGKMWGYALGQIKGREERKKVWRGKTGGATGKGWGLGVKI